MPVKIKKAGKKYRVETPRAVHSYATTLEKALRQERLLNAIDHGFKPLKRKKK